MKTISYYCHEHETQKFSHAFQKHFSLQDISAYPSSQAPVKKFKDLQVLGH